MIAGAKPGVGRITCQPGAKPNAAEIEGAEWLRSTFGGNIQHLAIRKTPDRKIPTPDYLWDGEAWEHKIASSQSGIVNRLKKASKQTDGNGALLNVGSDLSDEEILACARRAMVRSGLRKVIVRRGSRLVDVLRIDE